MRKLRSLRHWFYERLGGEAVFSFLRKKKVPLHRYSAWYFLGGITLFLFCIQVATGILLLLYYRPTPEEAFESVRYITAQVPFGWLVRSIHAWAANLMILFLLAHMFSVAFLRAYRRPRELTWLSGVVLLALVLTFGFSGYLLPWNTLAFFATTVGTNLIGQIPWVGHWLMVFLRGGQDVTGATLTRFFALHVALLPALATGFLLLHLFLVQIFGISLPPSIEAEWEAQPERRKEIAFFPDFMARELMAWYVALGLLGTLAAFRPWSLGTKADPFAPAPAGIRPEWYFMFVFQTLKILPAYIGPLTGEAVGVMAFGLAALLWALLPFFDRQAQGRRARWMTGVILFALGYISAMTLYGYWGAR
jgi:quinol-cytochrome oxidoreductase complex cytochrome b subunit